MLAMVYHIRLDQFEGPLDLLLGLIEKEKLDITQVSLAKVADQYLEYLKNEQSISLENLSSFLSIAARLVLIKSRALLPILNFTDEEEEAMEDLEIRLKLYQKFREASLRLGAMVAKKRPAYPRESFLGQQSVFYPPKDISSGVLHEHFLNVLGDIPVFEDLPEKEVAAVVSLEEKIYHLQTTLAERVESSFLEFAKTAKDRIEVIVSFLAVLELVKQRIIHVEQRETWSDIRIKKLDL